MALLSVGSRGPEVGTLQRELNRQLFPSPNLIVDSIFGPLTQKAVKAFQTREGLTPDGIVGPLTRAALGMPNPDKAFTHKIRLHFRSISLTDIPFNAILANTQVVYAQFGIKVEFASGQSLALDPAKAKALERIDGSCAWKVTTGEFAELLQLGGRVPATDIAVFFVDRFSESINGCGGHLKDRPACIVAKAGSKFCTAHEVCHVLLTPSFTPVHITDPNNLMHPVDVNRTKTPGLTAAQVTQVKASAQCLTI